MRLNETLDTNDVQEKTYAPLPAGWYEVQITSEADKNTKKGGVMIQYEMEVTKGQYAGRKVWDSHNYICPSSPKAEEIARDNLKRCGRACGLANLTDSSQLLGRVLEVKLAIDKNEDYGDKNIVKDYRKSENVPSTPQPSAPQPQASYSASANSGVAPWKR